MPGDCSQECSRRVSRATKNDGLLTIRVLFASKGDQRVGARRAPRRRKDGEGTSQPWPRGSRSSKVSAPMAAVSVVICTHNPRREFLLRALGALETQTLTRDQWELAIVDNA